MNAALITFAFWSGPQEKIAKATQQQQHECKSKMQIRFFFITAATATEATAIAAYNQ